MPISFSGLVLSQLNFKSVIMVTRQGWSAVAWSLVEVFTACQEAGKILQGSFAIALNDLWEVVPLIFGLLFDSLDSYNVMTH